MSVLFLFGLAIIGLAAQPGDGSTPYKNDYYVACTGNKPNCVQDKCVMFGPRTTLCTECLSGKVPINGACVGKDDSPADPSIDPTVCVTESITGSDASQRCTSCTDGTKASEAGGSTYFLFYGGCYNKNEWPGTHICETVSDGVCNTCAVAHGFVFANDGNSQEKCILCGDTAGFNDKVGIAGCSSCISLESPSTTSDNTKQTAVRCTSCVDPTKAPIDDACADTTSHVCQNGYCTHCASTHVCYKGGCYSKEGSGASICASDNLMDISGYSACKQCINPNEVPHNGNCRLSSEFGACNKDSTAGKCTACNRSSPNRRVFFYEGGCYTTNDLLGRTICTEASGGTCTTCNEAQGFFAKDSTCSWCDSTTAGAIEDCASCSIKSDGSNKLVCTSCKNDKYVSVSGTSCVTSCSASESGSCETGTCVCTCNVGTYFDNNSNDCIQCDSACLECKGPGSDNCIKCSSGKYTKMNGSDTVTCVDASGCGDGYYADPEELQCATCGIESCQACTPKDNNLVCTRCSPGFVSVDGFSCPLTCTELNQREEDGRCVCAEGSSPVVTAHASLGAPARQTPRGARVAT